MDTYPTEDFLERSTAASRLRAAGPGWGKYLTPGSSIDLKVSHNELFFLVNIYPFFTCLPLQLDLIIQIFEFANLFLKEKKHLLDMKAFIISKQIPTKQKKSRKHKTMLVKIRN